MKNSVKNCVKNKLSLFVLCLLLPMAAHAQTTGKLSFRQSAVKSSLTSIVSTLRQILRTQENEYTNCLTESRLERFFSAPCDQYLNLNMAEIKDLQSRVKAGYVRAEEGDSRTHNDEQGNLIGQYINLTFETHIDYAYNYDSDFDRQATAKRVYENMDDMIKKIEAIIAKTSDDGVFTGALSP